MGRYFDFHSHHPSHIKRGLVRCLYDRARSIITGQDDLQKEECHLAKVLRQNGYPNTFICTKQSMEAMETTLWQEGRRPPLVVLPYTEGVSETIR